MWYRKDVVNGEPSEEAVLRALTEELAVGSRGISVYVDQPHGHSSLTFYFSPGSSALAQQFGAEPCAPPDVDALEPLAKS